MPLEALPESRRDKCTIRLLKAEMDDEDRAYLDRLLASNLSGQKIADLINEADYNVPISGGTVNRHRASGCACGRSR